MMGVNHSVSKLLKDDCPDLFIMKCICHSFHLVSSYACAELPSYSEDLVTDVYNYIQKSPKRICKFKELQCFLGYEPHKILHPCQTRWLSLLPAIKRVREQFETLKLFFVDEVKSFDKTNKSCASHNILSMLNNPEIYLYFCFLEYVLPFFNDLNRLFQSEKPKVQTLYKDIEDITRALLSNFMDNSYVKNTKIYT